MSQTNSIIDSSRLSPIKGYEGYYSVSTSGNIYSHSTERWLKIMVNSRGYSRITLWRKGQREDLSVHRIVAKTFIPNPKVKPIVNHINGVKTDNGVSNLEWVTSKENRLHAIAIGLVTFGINHNFTNTTDRGVKIICRLKGLLSVDEISDLLGVTHKVVQEIHQGKTHKIR